jgi:uncharacterized membrane protein
MQTIVGVRRLEETLQRSAGNGDNWHMTWAQLEKPGRVCAVLGKLGGSQSRQYDVLR